MTTPNSETNCSNIQVLETYLKSYERRKCIASIIKTERVTKIDDIGDHYISNTWRQRCHVVCKDGHEEDVYVIIKSQPEDQFSKNYLLSNGLFGKEVKVYNEVLPAMEKLMKDNCDYNEPIWPNCIGYRCYNTIILEDLTCLGYKLVDPKIRLDLQHSIIAFRSLAKFHALSVILKDKCLLETYHLSRLHYMTQNEVRRQRMEEKFSTIAQLIRENGGPTLKNLADQMEKISSQALDKLILVSTRDENAFNVLNHGDPWTSNLLFKYCQFTNNVIGMRLVDFQIVYYGSYALDIQYLLNTSVQYNVINEHYDGLLSAYEDTLKKTFVQYKHEPVNLPNLDDIRAEVKNKRLFGILLSLYLLELMGGSNKENQLTIGSVVGSTSNFQSITKDKAYIERVIEIVKPYKDINFDQI